MNADAVADLVDRANALVDSGQLDDALAAYRDIADRFADRPEPEARAQAARALVAMGVALRGNEQAQEELAAYDEALERFGDAPEPPVQRYVARAMTYKGCALADTGDSDAAVRIYDAVIERFGDGDEAVVGEEVANALLNAGFALGQLDEHERALSASFERSRRSEPDLVDVALLSDPVLLAEGPGRISDRHRALATRASARRVSFVCPALQRGVSHPDQRPEDHYPEHGTGDAEVVEIRVVRDLLRQKQRPQDREHDP